MKTLAFLIAVAIFAIVMLINNHYLTAGILGVLLGWVVTDIEEILRGILK